MITLNHVLEVMADGKILVPGCEPTSAITSPTLLYLQKCKHPTVAAKDVLAAIPGSYLRFGVNFGRSGTPQMWLVLPPTNNNCPCEDPVDYYRIMKELSPEEPEDNSLDYCNILDQGFCPDPASIPTPEQSPYIKEGTFPLGGPTRLPFPPLWS